MINFRRAICKVLRKGKWLYDLCDCQRYEDKPHSYSDTVEESIRLDDTVVEVVSTPRCMIPYHRTGKLLVWSGALLTDWSIKDNSTWQEQNYPEYLNCLVRDGVNATRAFSWFEDNAPEWD